MRYPSKLHVGALRLMRQMDAEEIGRAARERADYRRAIGALPERILRVEFRYEWPEGQNVYNVYSDNLSEFNVYTAPAGSERDLALRELQS